MNPNRRQNVFELFGFDFLLDEDFRLWLIECNTNPYLGAPCAFMREMMPQMINDLFKIVVDPVFAPRIVPDASRENNFELIYKEYGDNSGPAVNKRRPFTFDLCYPIPQLKPFIGKMTGYRKEINNVSTLPQIKNEEDYKLERTVSAYNIDQRPDKARSKSISANVSFSILMKLRQKKKLDLDRNSSGSHKRQTTSTDIRLDEDKRRNS